MKRISLLFIMIFVLQFIINVNNCPCQWVPISNNISGNVNSFSSINGNIFVGTYLLLNNNPTYNPGVYITTNNGVNWTQTTFPYFAGSLHAKGTRLFATAYSNGSVSMYSDNLGVNWTNMNMQAYCFASNNTTLFAATGNGLLSSTNDGLNWSTRSSQVTPYLLVKDNFVYTAAGSANLWVSSNNGVNWTAANGITNSVYSLATNGTEIYAGTYDGGVLKSTDNGYNFTHTTAFSGYQIYSLVATGSYIIAGAFSGTGIYVSANKGTSWTQRNDGLGSSMIRTLFLANGFVFAAAGGTQIWRREFQNLVSVNNISAEISSAYSLSQNYPNPFNSSSKFKFKIAKLGNVKITVYDLIGCEVETLVNERLNAGTYSIQWNAGNYSSGVYFYRMQTEGYIETRKMTLIK